VTVPSPFTRPVMLRRPSVAGDHGSLVAAPMHIWRTPRRSRRSSRGRANFWAWPPPRPMLRQKFSRPSRPIRQRRRTPGHVPAAAAACSSSRPSRPAPNHFTGRPHFALQSASIRHDPERQFPHPNRRPPSSPVIDRPRRNAAQRSLGIAFLAALIPNSHRHQCRMNSTKPHQQPNPTGPTASLRNPRSDQIAIDGGARQPSYSTSRGFLPWRLSDDGPCPSRSAQWAVIRNPSQSETLRHVCDRGRFRRKQPWRPVLNAATISAILGVGPFPCEPARGRLSV
jgi:hypothetical protein